MTVIMKTQDMKDDGEDDSDEGEDDGAEEEDGKRGGIEAKSWEKLSKLVFGIFEGKGKFLT